MVEEVKAWKDKIGDLHSTKVSAERADAWENGLKLFDGKLDAGNVLEIISHENNHAVIHELMDTAIACGRAMFEVTDKN